MDCVLDRLLCLTGTSHGHEEVSGTSSGPNSLKGPWPLDVSSRPPARAPAAATLCGCPPGRAGKAMARASAPLEKFSSWVSGTYIIGRKYLLGPICLEASVPSWPPSGQVSPAEGKAGRQLQCKQRGQQSDPASKQLSLA